MVRLFSTIIVASLASTVALFATAPESTPHSYATTAKRICAQIFLGLREDNRESRIHRLDRVGRIDRQYDMRMVNLAWQASLHLDAAQRTIVAGDGTPLSIQLRSLEAIAAYPLFVEPGSIASFSPPEDLLELVALALQESAFAYLQRPWNSARQQYANDEWFVPLNRTVDSSAGFHIVRDRFRDPLFGYRTSDPRAHLRSLAFPDLLAGPQYVELLIPGGRNLWVFDRCFEIEPGGWLNVSLQRHPNGALEIIGLWPEGYRGEAMRARDALAIANHPLALHREVASLHRTLTRLRQSLTSPAENFGPKADGARGIVSPLMGAVGGVVSAFPVVSLTSSSELDPWLFGGLPLLGAVGGAYLGRSWSAAKDSVRYWWRWRRYCTAVRESTALKVELEARLRTLQARLPPPDPIRERFRRPVESEITEIPAMLAFSAWEPRSPAFQAYLEGNRMAVTGKEFDRVIGLFRTVEAHGWHESAPQVVERMDAFSAHVDTKKTIVTDAFHYLAERYGCSIPDYAYPR